MSIPVTDWECPPPKAGERPRKVFVSQVYEVFGEGEA